MGKIIQILGVIILLGGLSGCAELLRADKVEQLKSIKAGNYVLDKDHASLVFKVDHQGYSKFIGRFNEFDASLNFDAENPENSTLEAIVEIASVDLVSDDFEEILRSSTWFNVGTFSQAFFKTLSSQKISENHIRFNGQLTFMGETHEQVIDVFINGASYNYITRRYTVGFSADAIVKRSVFGLKRYVPTVGDDVELEIHAEFQRGD